LSVIHLASFSLLNWPSFEAQTDAATAAAANVAPAFAAADAATAVDGNKRKGAAAAGSALGADTDNTGLSHMDGRSPKRLTPFKPG